MPATVGAAIRWGTGQLHRAGVETPAVDSRLLMAYALADHGDNTGEQRADSPHASQQVELPRMPLSISEVFFSHDHATPAIFAQWIAQRTQRQPLQHIVGAATFDGVDFLSRPGAFIPRPETELLVDWAFHEALHRAPATGRVTVVDLCTGPGTIALALACRFTDANRDALIIGVELHDGALQVARANEAQLRQRNLVGSGVEVRFHQADLLKLDEVRIAQQRLLAGEAAPAVIVSNPPYVPASAAVSDEVRHDPFDAVFAGEDGMEFLPGLLRALGIFAGGERVGVGIEHDDANGPATATALEQAGTTEVKQHRDVAGRDRFVTAEWL